MTAADFDYVSAFVRDMAAIVLEPRREYLVESRMQTLARRENLPTVGALVAKLRDGPNHGLHRKVVDAMTTSETSFFRDLPQFDALRKTILPELLTRHAQEQQLNFWCGAASTGQEPYSVLLLLADDFPELLKWDLKFVATDLCGELIARARAGRYNQLEVNRGLPATMLGRHFTRQGAEWELKAELRGRVDFRELNLAQNWPSLPSLDLVFLRNVLVYFDGETQRAILAKVRRLLRPGGYLLLGETETALNVDDAFERVALANTACYRVRAA